MRLGSATFAGAAGATREPEAVCVGLAGVGRRGTEAGFNLFELLEEFSLLAVQRRGQGFLLRAEHPEGLLDLLNLEGQLLFDLAQQGRIVHRVERPGDTRRGQTERTGVVGRGNRRHTGRGGCGNSRCRSGFGGGRRRRGGFAILRLKTKLAQLRTDLLHPLGVVRGVGLQGRKLVQQGLFLFLRRLGLLRLRDKERGAHRQDGCQYPNSSLMKRDAKHSYLPL